MIQIPKRAARAAIAVSVFVSLGVLILLLSHREPPPETSALLQGSYTTPEVRVSEGRTPLVIQLNDWHSQQVFSHVVGQLLEHMGQPVDYQESDAVLQFESLAAGDAHFQVEVWHNRMAPDLERALDGGAIEAGQHGLRFRDGWWVSDATLSVCPGAYRWSGLVACAVQRGINPDAGSTESVSGQVRGTFYAPPAVFDRDDLPLITALRMPFEVESTASLSALQAVWRSFDRERELQEGAPVRAVYSWSPNTVRGPTQGRFVEFPAPERACFSDPGWGSNPDLTGDCGGPRSFPVSKAAWAGVLDLFPAAWPLLQAASFDATDYRQVVGWMSDPSASPASAASRWIEANTDRVESWLRQTL